jgi:hypothetical protein
VTHTLNPRNRRRRIERLKAKLHAYISEAEATEDPIRRALVTRKAKALWPEIRALSRDVTADELELARRRANRARVQERAGLPRLVPVIDEPGIVRIDERSLIRESRAYEATTGPPRRPGVENDQAPFGGRGPDSFSVRRPAGVKQVRLEATANLPRISRNLKPEFFRSENCAQNPGAASAERTPENGGFADEFSRKTRH